MSIRVGIFFGGASREREVSFAGGRTVYDNLDKSLYTAIPYFVDHKGNIVELNWPYIYRGTIRDFFPPAAFIPESKHPFQIYADSLELDSESYEEMLQSLGKIVKLEDLRSSIDIAFLALHGRSGEDGSIQGLLEFLGIPYTGSGIGSSALGMNKAMQKCLMENSFDVPAYEIITANQWGAEKIDGFFEKCIETVGLPMVVKPANQGSSLGVTVIEHEEIAAFRKAVEHAFFRYELSREEWEARDKLAWVRRVCDVREGIGLPLLLNGKLIHHPEKLLNALEQEFSKHDHVLLEALDHENQVIIESFIAGREFSCVVILDDQGEPIALPPTEIIKGGKVYTYQGKYLPGLSRKETPIACDQESLNLIRRECERLFKYLGFEVYARIDGFLDDNGKVFLNDPNTTSGMMPSSFFFHQAAEIGLDPSHFVSYILRTSLAERLRKQTILHPEWQALLHKMDEWLERKSAQKTQDKRIAVIMGGYSTERHISVESGRNIYEKIGSSAAYTAIPVFLSGDENSFKLHHIPISMMLKDNADDIKAHIDKHEHSDAMIQIRAEFEDITRKYAGADAVFTAEEWDYKRLKEETDAVFIALHGRPGEDGALQKQLLAHGIPFNGSGVESSQLTINKYLTNKFLREKGFLVADHMLIDQRDWVHDKENLLRQINAMGYPLIAKPADDGCSSAVKKIDNQSELEAYATITFRSDELIPKQEASLLELGLQEEFPARTYFLLESFIDRESADHFLEITGGMLTSFLEDGSIAYEVFEASEALAGGEVLSLAEKFLAGEGQNITPARYHKNPQEQKRISEEVKTVFEKVAKALNIEGYCRIDAFVRIFANGKIEVVIIEVNSLPGMTPATCIYHQAAMNGYKPAEFINRILDYGQLRQEKAKQT